MNKTIKDMKKDIHETKVVFLINERTDELFAYFPEENYNHLSETTKTCYSHVGQHSACCIAYAKESRVATKEEYNDMKEELESIGYVLELVTEF